MPHRFLRLLCILTTLFLITPGAFAQIWEPPTKVEAVPKPPGFSGMVKFDPSSFLVVHDAKDPSNDPRVSVLSVGFGRAPYVSPVSIDWRAAGAEPNDLEAICAIPGKGDRFLVCESRYFNGLYGRVIEIALTRNHDGFFASVKEVYRLPELPDEIEGMACVKRKDKPPLVILATRGGKQPGELIACTMDATKHQIVPLEGKGSRVTLVSPAEGRTHPDQRRDCADIYIDAKGRILAVATADPGDSGAFRSVIYEAGTIDSDSNDPITITATQANPPKPFWILDGIKIEALAAPAIEGSMLSVASDDEDYGGVWRPLALPHQKKSEKPEDATNPTSPKGEAK